MFNGLTLAFDLDGTMVETAPDLIGATNFVLQTEGLSPVDGTMIRPEISFGARRMITRGLELHGAVRTEREIDNLLQQFLDYYAANIAVESRAFPGLLRVLAHYKAQGCKLTVCTNKREGLSRQLLAQLDLLPLFDAIAGRDTFAVCKPHPDHLIGAVRLAGGDPSRAVMIGDSDTDISTARAAGIPSIGVTFGYTDVPISELGASEIIDHFDEFDAALARILENLPFKPD